jgi:uncharacterized surface protein with fasciclin (FAS1) repeats
MLKLLSIIIIIILSSSSSSSSPLNLPKILLKDPSHSFETASSEFNSVHIDTINSQFHFTIFVPDDQAFADAARYKSLPIESKYFVLQCHMMSTYLPPSQLHTVLHLQPTVGTEIIGDNKYMLNITTIVNGSVEVSNTFLRALVTRTLFDHSPVVIYGVSEVLLPRDLPVLQQIPPPMDADVAAAVAVWGFNFLLFYIYFSFLVLCV